jgi:argininosuccinate lyase
MQMHNIAPGMPDPKEVDANGAVVNSAIVVLKDWDRVLKALVISPSRALEELNSDWTASQELADVLMRRYKVPFRIGHHFASELVDFAKARDIKPLDFPYAEARRIYAESVAGTKYPAALPLGEAEFRSTLDPAAIVRNRATAGGPQPAEMDRMLRAAQQRHADRAEWANGQRTRIAGALARLDTDFQKLLKPAD